MSGVARTKKGSERNTTELCDSWIETFHGKSIRMKGDAAGAMGTVVVSAWMCGKCT